MYSSIDKAHLRLASAKAVLRLSKHWNHKIPVDVFHLTLKISEVEPLYSKIFSIAIILFCCAVYLVIYLFKVLLFSCSCNSYMSFWSLFICVFGSSRLASLKLGKYSLTKFINT